MTGHVGRKDPRSFSIIVRQIADVEFRTTDDFVSDGLHISDCSF